MATPKTTGVRTSAAHAKAVADKTKSLQKVDLMVARSSNRVSPVKSREEDAVAHVARLALALRVRHAAAQR